MTGDSEQSEQAASYCFPELAMELAQYESTVGALPHNTTGLPTEARMLAVKGKLFDRFSFAVQWTILIQNQVS